MTKCRSWCFVCFVNETKHQTKPKQKTKKMKNHQTAYTSSTADTVTKVLTTANTVAEKCFNDFVKQVVSSYGAKTERAKASLANPAFNAAVSQVSQMHATMVVEWVRTSSRATLIEYTKVAALVSQHSDGDSRADLEAMVRASLTVLAEHGAFVHALWTLAASFVVDFNGKYDQTFINFIKSVVAELENNVRLTFGPMVAIISEMSAPVRVSH